LGQLQAAATELQSKEQAPSIKQEVTSKNNKGKEEEEKDDESPSSPSPSPSPPSPFIFADFKIEDLNIEDAHEEDAIRKIMSMNKKTFTATMMKAYHLLINAIGDGQMHHIKNCQKGNANAVWRKLLSQFERNTTSNKMYILKKLFNTKLPPGGETSKFINHIDQQTRILEGMDFKVQDPYKLCALLSGLPPEFAHIVTHIECTEKASYQFACERIIDFDQKIKQDKASENTASVERTFYTDAGPRKCFKCHQPGHFAKDCKQQKTNAYNHKECKKCGRRGHQTENCWKECKKCGRRGHQTENCWSRDVTCDYCLNRGHLAKECRKRKHDQAESDEANNMSTYYSDQATFPVFHTTHRKPTNRPSSPIDSLSKIVEAIDRHNPSVKNGRMHHALMITTEASIAGATEASIAGATEASIAGATEASIAGATEASIARATEASIARATEASIAGATEGSMPEQLPVKSHEQSNPLKPPLLSNPSHTTIHGNTISPTNVKKRPDGRSDEVSLSPPAVKFRDKLNSEEIADAIHRTLELTQHEKH
jgi:hypothetical protein